jgi:YesN/AraC family two-component response regulator
VGDQIQLDNRTEDCAILLNFLRVASIGRLNPARCGPDLPPLTAQPVLVAPIADEAYMRHIHRVLVQVLPGTNLPAGTAYLGQQLLQGTAMIRQSIIDQGEAQRDERQRLKQEEKTPKSMMEAYPAITPSLMRLCLINAEAELPEFWQRFAMIPGKKGQAHIILQQLMSVRASQEDSAQVHTVLTASMYDHISKFQHRPITFPDMYYWA